MSFSSITHLVGTLYLFYLSLKILKFVIDALKTLLLGGSIDFTKFGSWAGKPVLTLRNFASLKSPVVSR